MYYSGADTFTLRPHSLHLLTSMQFLKETFFTKSCLLMFRLISRDQTPSSLPTKTKTHFPVEQKIMRQTHDNDNISHEVLCLDSVQMSLL